MFSILLTALAVSVFSRGNLVHGMKTGDFLYYDALGGQPYTVTYDERSFIINGERTLLLGGSVHYPRLSPGQWNDILSKARNDGLNHVEVYVFWNIHEPSYDLSGNHSYTLEGRANLTGFLETAKNNGLFVNLRIGPYVCAEWAFGGLPVWLLHVPNISFRDNNEPWEEEMSTFVKWVANLVEPYLAKNGGPIILAQIENEYHGSTEYVTWCGNLAASLNLEIPWVMCNGESANNTVNTCNGNDCYSSYVPSHSSKYPNQPLAWTENEGWFQYWAPSSGNVYIANETGWANRSPENMAYVVATWFGAGAAHHNYYMWYGGNHVSWTAGSAITSYYADGVNYHADGLANEPKRSHLSKLHSIIADNQIPMLENTIQYGNEIYIIPDGLGQRSLYYETCDDSSVYQRFSLASIDNNSNNLLQWKSKYCAISTGSSDPVEMVSCNDTSTYQQWSYDGSNSLQIKSVATSKCLDVFGGTGPNIDEYDCKDPSSSDASNQQWMYNTSTQMFVSKLNSDKCLTVSNATSSTFAYVYETNSSKVTFLVNVDSSQDYTVSWEGISYYLPGQSVSILDSQGEELFNTGKVDTSNVPSKRVYKTLYSGASDLSFESWTETVPLTNNPQNRTDSSTYNNSPMEQIRFSNNTSEYLYYSSEISTDFSSLNSELNVRFGGRCATAYNVWFNSEYLGTSWNGAHSKCALNISVGLNTSENCAESETACVLTILSSNLGIDNGINNQQGSNSQDKKGIVGDVWLYDVSNKKLIDNYTSDGWQHWIGSSGENLNVAGSGGSKITWSNPAITSMPMTWYRTYFATPDISLFMSINKNEKDSQVTGVLLLDIGSNGKGLQRGHWWLNGMDMGHYHNAFETSNDDAMVQQYYYIPIDYLVSPPGSGMNELVFEEELPFDTNNDITNVNLVYSTFVIPQ